jgi:hypothetical protein
VSEARRSGHLTAVRALPPSVVPELNVSPPHPANRQPCAHTLDESQRLFET